MTLLRNALIGASALTLAACGANNAEVASASDSAVSDTAADTIVAEDVTANEHKALFALFSKSDEANLKLNPINATFAGDNRYNNSFPNSLSDEHKAKSKSYFTKYLSKLSQFKDEDLAPTSCKITLEAAKIEMNARHLSDIAKADKVKSCQLPVATMKEATNFSATAYYLWNWFEIDIK